MQMFNTDKVLASLVKALRQKSFSNSSTMITWDPFPVKSFSDSDVLKQDFLWPVCLSTL
jgi:hypothetical protein